MMKRVEALQLDKSTLRVLVAAQTLMSDQLAYIKKNVHQQEEANQFISQDIQGIVHQLISRGITGTQKEFQIKAMIRTLDQSLILRKTFDVSRKQTKLAMQQMQLEKKDLRLVQYNKFKQQNLSKIMDIVCDQERIDKSILKHRDYSVNVQLATLSCYSEYVSKFHHQLKGLAAAVKRYNTKKTDSQPKLKKTNFEPNITSYQRASWFQNISDIKQRLKLEKSKFSNNLALKESLQTIKQSGYKTSPQKFFQVKSKVQRHRTKLKSKSKTIQKPSPTSKPRESINQEFQRIEQLRKEAQFKTEKALENHLRQITTYQQELILKHRSRLQTVLSKKRLLDQQFQKERQLLGNAIANDHREGPKRIIRTTHRVQPRTDTRIATTLNRLVQNQIKHQQLYSQKNKLSKLKSISSKKSKFPPGLLPSSTQGRKFYTKPKTDQAQQQMKDTFVSLPKKKFHKVDHFQNRNSESSIIDRTIHKLKRVAQIYDKKQYQKLLLQKLRQLKLRNRILENMISI